MEIGKVVMYYSKRIITHTGRGKKCGKEQVLLPLLYSCLCPSRSLYIFFIPSFSHVLALSHSILLYGCSLTLPGPTTPSQLIIVVSSLASCGFSSTMASGFCYSMCALTFLFQKASSLLSPPFPFAILKFSRVVFLFATRRPFSSLYYQL